jgi:hypothetical protein
MRFPIPVFTLAAETRGAGPREEMTTRFISALKEIRACPARQGVADGFGEFALLNKTKFCPQPGFEIIDERPTFLVPDGATFVGVAAAAVLLDGIEPGDMFERFACNRRRSWRQTPKRAAGWTVIIPRRLISGKLVSKQI